MPRIALITIVIVSSSAERRRAAAANPKLAPAAAMASPDGVPEVPSQAAPHAVAATGTMRRSGE
jgi:hypothetical protein